VSEERSIADWIRLRAGEWPDALAYYADSSGETQEARPLTWSGYDRASDELAGALISLGYDPGERIAVWLPDGLAVHVAYAAIEKAGLVIVGIGARAGVQELRHLLALTGASGIVTSPDSRDGEAGAMGEIVAELRREGLALRYHLVIGESFASGTQLWVDGARLECSRTRASSAARDAERRTNPEDLFLLNSTSGTTGMPKCVKHDQLRWFRFHEFAVEAGVLSQDDIFMSVVPAPFGFGIWTAHVTPTLLGVTAVLMPRFDATAALASIERHRVTVLAAVSTQFILMLASSELARRDLGSLRVLFTGGEAVPREKAEEFEERTGARVLQFYGSNEVGAVSRTTLDDPKNKRLGSAGRIIPAMNVRLFDDAGKDVTAEGRGQPGCKGPTLSGGYWGDEEATAKLFTEEGWMLLGDIVEIDADGYLEVIGRTDDFIIRGGKNISAAAVEEQVARHPAVSLAAAVAAPDPVFGERVCVYVELAVGSGLTLEALVEELLSRGCSKEILPEYLVVMHELPRASGGKIAKRWLREDAKQRFSRA